MGMAYWRWTDDALTPAAWHAVATGTDYTLTQGPNGVGVIAIPVLHGGLPVRCSVVDHLLTEDDVAFIWHALWDDVRYRPVPTCAVHALVPVTVARWSVPLTLAAWWAGICEGWPIAATFVPDDHPHLAVHWAANPGPSIPPYLHVTADQQPWPDVYFAYTRPAALLDLAAALGGTPATVLGVSHDAE